MDDPYGDEWQVDSDGSMWRHNCRFTIKPRGGRFDLIEDGREEEQPLASFATMAEAQDAYLAKATS